MNSGCSISTASASMMTDVVLGKTKYEALKLAEIFSQMVQGKKISSKRNWEMQLFWLVLLNFPQRIKCSTLGWNALKRQLKKLKSLKKINN